VPVVARTVGELLITAGVVIMLLIVYLLWWTDVRQHEAQRTLLRQLEQEWAAPASPAAAVIPVSVAEGKGIAVLRVPRLGASYREVVVEGTGYDDLRKGPGHYPETPMPGAVGNVAVAGHRVTQGHPFRNLDQVQPGDEIVLETRTAWYTYRAIAQQTVRPTDTSVVAAVPPGAPAHGVWPRAQFSTGERLLTFTTCTPPYSATYRLVVQSLLVAVDQKHAGFLPAALRPGHGLAGQG
jgi:sortase A